jgi:hypothetical protein
MNWPAVLPCLKMVSVGHHRHHYIYTQLSFQNFQVH